MALFRRLRSNGPRRAGAGGLGARRRGRTCSHPAPPLVSPSLPLPHPSPPVSSPPRDAMAKMTKAFNASYIIGLPLWRHNAVDNAREMMAIAEKYIPSTHIVGYELGNEVGRVEGRPGAGAAASGRSPFTASVWGRGCGTARGKQAAGGGAAADPARPRPRPPPCPPARVLADRRRRLRGVRPQEVCARVSAARGAPQPREGRRVGAPPRAAPRSRGAGRSPQAPQASGSALPIPRAADTLPTPPPGQHPPPG
jgi:hypothetical protein